jgi:predicted phosphodiesterase
MNSRSTCRSKSLILAIVLVACVIAGGCTPELITPTPYMTKTPSETVPPSPTPLPTATSTLTPEPTATPIAEIKLDGGFSDVSYTLPLTMHHITPTSALLFFELSRPGEAAVFYWPSVEVPNYAVRRDLAADSARHQVKIDGLTPGTEYQVTVGILDQPGVYLQPAFAEEVWGPLRLSTAMPEEAPLRIGVLGDSGFGQQATWLLAEEMADKDLDFVLHTGDVVYNVFEEPSPFESFARKYFQPFAPLLHEMPIYPVVGNHDVDSATLWAGVPFYFNAFPPFDDLMYGPSEPIARRDWYAFAYGQVQFIMLNTQHFFGGGLRAEQTSWLEERLQDPHYSASILVFHVPLFNSGLHANEGRGVRSEWLPLFEAARVPLVLSGHDHDYERLVVDGITHVVSGGGSTTLYSLSSQLPESQVFARRTHFVLLEVFHDHIDLTAIALGGEVLDEATIPLQPS